MTTQAASNDGSAPMQDTLLDTSSKPTLASLAQQHLPIVVPWNPAQVIYPGQLFHSNLATSADPWSKSSPFLSGDDPNSKTPSRTVYLSADGGTSGSFKSTKTQCTTAKVDHESFEFTATVNLGFAKASASIQFDHDLSTNNDASLPFTILMMLCRPGGSESLLYEWEQDIKTSFRSSYRCGSVLLRQAAELSQEAQLLLKYNGGIEAFEKKYGDYFVLGYNLGADNQMMVSTSAQSMSQTERMALAVRVEFLFFDISFSYQIESHQASSNSSLRVTGYDTLSHSNLDKNQSWSSTSTVEFDRVRQESAKMKVLGSILPTRVEQRAREIGLPVSDRSKGIPLGSRSIPLPTGPYAPLAALEYEVDIDLCSKLVRSGLVVELVLAPVRSLRQVRYWMTEDDIV
ncbi:unnamed protein product [Tilletia laevis]|uniref:Uncharacterized protein n=2 Tax=Tilletia TaxID=13289 RepID=A0A177T2W7_9BASI|nr:hypothetical protein CF336_g8851 [Tilletia laevis]KAE8240747.1 hypothetical protein A4X03_0g8400 [Tilletia caries]KAE8182708.1 hypothetical protein CF335_g8549 [Tilletia laevis]CAD6898040.1 unnamed protein product [Tilletia caries]CAD6906618.1 unnamed protein product [Tilletia caries]